MLKQTRHEHIDTSEFNYQLNLFKKKQNETKLVFIPMSACIATVRRYKTEKRSIAIPILKVAIFKRNLDLPLGEKPLSYII